MNHHSSILSAMLLIACTPAEHVSLKREDVARVAVKIPSAVVDVVPPALAPRPEPSPVDGFVFDGQTLSVEGSAEVLADPDVAYFHTELSARDVPMRFSQPMQLADAAPIVRALVAAGIPGASIHQALRDDPYRSGPSQAGRPGAIDITFTVVHPSGPGIRRLGEVISQASGYPAFHAFSDAVYARANCDEAYAAVIREALTNAHRVAVAQIAMSGRRVGTTLGVEQLTLNERQGLCGLGSTIGPQQLVFRNVEPADAGKVVVSSTLRVTFEIL